MDLKNFLHSLQIIHFLTIYTFVNAANEIIQQLDNKNGNSIIHNVNDIAEADLLYNLTHPNNLPTKCPDLKRKMRTLYKSTLISKANNLTFKHVFSSSKNFYHKANLSLTMRFENYFAINYYNLFASGQINYDTDLSRRMRNALYSVAITQSSIGNGKFRQYLYKNEAKTAKWINTTHKTIKLSEKNKFIKVMTNETSTIVQGNYTKINRKFNHVLYELHFPKPYLSVNLKDFDVWNDEIENVLLPEMTFSPDSVTSFEVGKKTFFKIKMTHNSEQLDLLGQQKRAISKIKELQETGTKFYIC